MALKRRAVATRATPERRPATTAAPEPNRAHCHGAKVASNLTKPQLQDSAPIGHPQLVNDVRSAVQTPIPMPTGIEPQRRIVGAVRVMNACYFQTNPTAGR